MLKKEHFWWLLPLVGVLLFTPFLAVWDLQIERSFYNGQIFHSNPYLDFFYDRAVLPGLWVGFAAMLVLLLSWFKKYRHYRNSALQMVLTLVIGAGFIVHTILKDHWGRPRPKQVEEFGGTQAFRPYYSPNFFHQPEPSRSFPCGHCTVGFYFFALGLVFKRWNQKKWEWFFYILALVLGTLLGLTRMAQGGHFLSDVVWSALIMWWVANLFDRFIHD